MGLPLFEQVGKKIYMMDMGREPFGACSGVFASLERFEMTVADVQGLETRPSSAG